MNKKAIVPPKEKPTRPLNFYFRLRAERFAALEGQANRVKIFAEEWKNISEATKDAETAKDKIEMDNFRMEMDLWRKAKVEKMQLGRREKKELDGNDSDDGKRKVEKSRGRPAAKAAKDEDTENEEKQEKGKSKGKGIEKGKGKVEQKPKVEEKNKKNK